MKIALYGIVLNLPKSHDGFPSVGDVGHETRSVVARAWHRPLLARRSQPEAVWVWPLDLCQDPFSVCLCSVNRSVFSVSGQGQESLKMMIFGIVTRIDLLNFITSSEQMPASCCRSTSPLKMAPSGDSVSPWRHTSAYMIHTVNASLQTLQTCWVSC